MQVRRRKQQSGIEFDPPEFASVQSLSVNKEPEADRIRELVEEFKPLVRGDNEFIPAMQGVLEDEGFSDQLIDAIVAELEEYALSEEPPKKPQGWANIQV